VSGGDDSEKQHEPTQKKLDDARRKGEIPRSNDLSSAVAYAGFLLVALSLGGWVCQRLASLGMALLWQISEVGLASGQFAGGLSVKPFVGHLGATVVPIGFVPALAVLTALVARRGLVFAPEKMAPKLSRISPVENAKNKFGRSGLFEFAKSAVKLLLVTSVLALFLKVRSTQIAGLLWLEPRVIAAQMAQLALEFLSILVVLLAVIGGLDLMWQVMDHKRRNRMSRKELQDEQKDSEGDPYVKQQRRQRGQEIALNSMLRDVAESTVVIVNPEHYAVALKWSPSFPGPPSCTAKGVDGVAAQIRKAANEAGVPIHRDPPTARTLHATVEIGQEILPEHYRPVAAAIRFADRMRQLARTRALD
jgi:flagellar biosynthetic protein FlhB